MTKTRLCSGTPAESWRIFAACCVTEDSPNGTSPYQPRVERSATLGSGALHRLVSKVGVFHDAIAPVGRVMRIHHDVAIRAPSNKLGSQCLASPLADHGVLAWRVRKDHFVFLPLRSFRSPISFKVVHPLSIGLRGPGRIRGDFLPLADDHDRRQFLTGCGFANLLDDRGVVVLVAPELTQRSPSCRRLARTRSLTCRPITRS